MKERDILFAPLFRAVQNPLNPPLEKGEKVSPTPPFVKGGRGDFPCVAQGLPLIRIFPFVSENCVCAHSAPSIVLSLG